MQTVIRIKDLELRWSDSFGKNPRKYLEIVRWDEISNGRPYCYTIATWYKSSDKTFDVMFVGALPFDDQVDHALFWNMAKEGQSIMTAQSNLEQLSKDHE